MISFSQLCQIAEGMFPKGFNRHQEVCGIAVAYATMHLLSRGRKDFTVKEGVINFHGIGSWEHGWIQFDNGRIFDPTRKQFKLFYNLDLDKLHHAYEPDTSYTPDEYLKTIQKSPEYRWYGNLKLQKQLKQDIIKWKNEQVSSWMSRGIPIESAMLDNCGQEF